MIQENEIIMLILGIGVTFFTQIYKAHIKRITSWKNLLAGLYVMLAAWIFTILEAFLWTDYLNLMEHVCYAASAVLMAIWCFRLLFDKKRVIR